MNDFNDFLAFFQKNSQANYEISPSFDPHAQFRTKKSKAQTYKHFIQLKKKFSTMNKQVSGSMRLGFNEQNPKQRTNRKAIPTIKDFSSLQEITCMGLLFNEVNRGKFIKLKIAYKPFLLSSIHVLGQDSEGGFVQFSLYNFDLHGRSPQSYFIVNEVVYIKEPFFKKGSDNVFIRVDNPQDVVFEAEMSKQLTDNNNFEQIKKKGRELIQKDDYLNAYIVYKDGIRKTQPKENKAVLMMNKAICCKQLNLQQEYLQSCQQALILHPKNKKKPLYHKIKHHIHNGTPYQIPQNIFSPQQINQLNALQGYVSGMRHGEFNWQRIIINKELGQYHSHSFQFRQGQHGIGAYAKESIRGNTVLFMECSMLTHPCPLNVSPGDKLNERGVFNDKIYTLSRESPEFMRRMKRLCRAGTTELSLVRREESADLSREEIIDVINTNCFFVSSIEDEIISKLGTASALEMYSLYERCSFFNHSCDENCDYFVVGRYMMVYAARDIKAGDQLYICYDLKKEPNKLETQRGFVCGCQYCEDLQLGTCNSEKMKILQAFRVGREELREEEVTLMMRSNKMVGLRALLMFKRNKEPAKVFLKKLLKIEDEQLAKIFWHCTEVEKKRMQ